MGRTQALEMCHYADNLDQALRWHLQSNHFPPITLDLLPVAKKAIEIANEAIALDESTLWDTTIYVPTAGKELPVWKIIEGMHLDSFLDTDAERALNKRLDLLAIREELTAQADQELIE